MESTMLETNHPTREEWVERQAKMPPGMRAMIAARLAMLNAERTAEQAREDARAKRLRDRLNDFELALREVVAGAEWLSMYRDTVPIELARDPFSEVHRSWAAIYDLTRVGGWRVWVSIPLDGRGWDTSRAVFTAVNPVGQRRTPTLADAVRLASEYCSTPF